MTIEVLVTLTYIISIMFMMVLVWGIGIVTVLRRMRLQNVSIMATLETKSPRNTFANTYTSTDNWREWNNKRRDNTMKLEDGHVVMPMRYQQPLIFGDPLTQTTKANPVIDPDEAKAS